MASVDVRPTRRNGREVTVYDVRFGDPASRQRKKTFPKRVEADRFTVSVETDKTRGAYTDAFRGKLPVGQ